MRNNTILSAHNWVDNVVNERGIIAARQIMTYNVTKNQYFRESNIWIMAAWCRINQHEDKTVKTTPN